MIINLDEERQKKFISFSDSITAKAVFNKYKRRLIERKKLIEKTIRDHIDLLIYETAPKLNNMEFKLKCMDPMG